MSDNIVSISEMESYLRDHLSQGTYEHSLRVRDTAIKLAGRFSADKGKAEIAGLLHDCAKTKNVLEQAGKLGVKLDGYMRENPGIAHAAVGAKLAETVFNIDDEEILNAISSHTLGREGMSDLDKIVYLADVIEEGRDFEGVEVIRKKARKSLDMAMIEALSASICYIASKKREIHPMTVYSYNDLICKEKK